ncbi:NADH-quinone oxidoreductase subunit NuoN [Halofilum ochraceum]|uniref:NADH-quinone oxidoreductase subunit NuoN n=1 Tax=Halofilum ochraceum TaxID=1611323 RepID=UPI0008D96B03|nr:NADH-quinone oxidoreductase subunit NuoN [Halofilum ochraceum]
MTSQFLPLLPEITLAIGACVVLVVDLFVPPERRDTTFVFALAALVATLVATVVGQPDGVRILFGGSYIADPMSLLLKLTVIVLTFFVFVYSRPYLAARGLYNGEYFALGLFGLLGMLIMISGYSMLTIYLGLELLSLCQYALVAFNRDSPRASEAAMKYFVLGAFASGMLLYGMSLIYGLTGSLEVIEIHNYLIRHGVDQIGALLGLIFIIVGLSFKLGAVPFHAWVPDVYEGAPTAVALYIASAPKVAAFALFMRMLAEGLGVLQADWQVMLAVLAVLSLVLGNVVAIAQTNLKRMLAYSTISHVGFILLGLLAGTAQGYSAAMFYVIFYALVTAGAFGMIILLSRRGLEAEQLDDFRGLNARSPWFALMMLFIMFSMAGVPPFAGFYAKLSVLRAVVQVDEIWLAIVAVVFSVVGAFYYLRVVKLMYFDEPEETGGFQEGTGLRAALSVNGLSMLALGLYPAALMSWCLAAVSW